MRRASILAPALALALATVSPAAVIRVPAEQPTIRAGVDAAADGDTVRVDCGTYHEHDIRIEYKAVTVLGTHDSRGCVTIDAEGLGPIFVLYFARDSRFERLTLTEGVSGFDLSGRSYSVSIHDCVFHRLSGRAIVVRDSGTNLLRCRIRECDGVAASVSSALTLVDCVIANNGATGSGGLLSAYDSHVLVTGTTFAQNDALCFRAWERGWFDVRQSTLYGNASCVDAGFLGTIELRGSILAFNDAVGGCSSSSAGLFVSCVDSYGNGDSQWPACVSPPDSLNRNFSSDPLFCDAEHGDLGLRPASPCLPGNHPGGYVCGRIGAMKLSCGESLRPLALEPETWGRIKSRYR